jgi:hypothetical protein
MLPFSEDAKMRIFRWTDNDGWSFSLQREMRNRRWTLI